MPKSLLEQLPDIVAPGPQGRATLATVRLGWQGLHAGGPDNNSAGDRDHIGQTSIGEPLAKRRVNSIARIGQDPMAGRAWLEQRSGLLQGNLRLGRQRDVFGNACLLAAFFLPNGVFGPGAGQIERFVEADGDGGFFAGAQVLMRRCAPDAAGVAVAPGGAGSR